MAYNQHLACMAATLIEYRTDPILCDALILVDDGELRAHSVILAAASPIFKAAMTVPNVPHCIRIANVSMDVMALALDTIYTGSFRCEDSLKFLVKQVLFRLDVDISKMDKGDINDLEIKSDRESSYSVSDDESVSCCDPDEDDHKSNVQIITDDIVEVQTPNLNQSDESTTTTHNETQVTSQESTDQPHNTSQAPSDKVPQCRSEDSVNQLLYISPEAADQSQDSSQVPNNQLKAASHEDMILASQAGEVSYEETLKQVEECCPGVESVPEGSTGPIIIINDQEEQERERIDQWNNAEILRSNVVNNSSVIERSCKCKFQCRRLEPTQRQRLRELFKSLCYTRQCLFLASLIETVKPLRCKSSKDPPVTPKRQWTVKYWIPLTQNGPRVRVCQTTFCDVFSVGQTKLYIIVRKSLAKQGFRDKRGTRQKADKSTAAVTDVSAVNRDESNSENDPLANNMTVENKSNDDCHASNMTLFSDCQCRQCKGTFRCDYCGHISWTSQTHAKHVWKQCKVARKYQDSVAERADRFDCKFCSNTFTTWREMTDHKFAVHGRRTEKRDHVCDICNKHMSTRTGLKNHRASHRGELLNLCQVCGKKVNSKRSLVRHVARYHSENSICQYKCNLCPEVFVRQLMCIKHKEKVHGISNARVSLFCDACGACLGSKCALRNHIKKFCHARKPEEPEERYFEGDEELLAALGGIPDK